MVKSHKFKSHKFNFQTGETRIEYADIISIETRNTFGIIPNQMFIYTKDKVEHRFVINNRAEVIAFINSKYR